MKYLDKTHIAQLNDNWTELFAVIKGAIETIGLNDFSQPIKPYLRFKDRRNRIIAMPAYIGGDVNMAGIKWIASFPGNIVKGKERANSATILNNADTGEIECVINTAEVSSIRTAAVTGAFIKRIFQTKHFPQITKIGIIGYGPIAKMHISMLRELLIGVDYEINVCDINYTKDNTTDTSLIFHNSYEAFFESADIIITATNSSEPYIDRPPKKGSIHLNVSLRDYKNAFFKSADKVFVDNWEEVCRENTDIERVYLAGDLKKENVIDLIEFYKSDNSILKDILDTDTISFNPMGMAVFDIAVATYFYKKAEAKKIGNNL